MVDITLFNAVKDWLLYKHHVTIVYSNNTITVYKYPYTYRINFINSGVIVSVRGKKSRLIEYCEPNFFECLSIALLRR